MLSFSSRPSHIATRGFLFLVSLSLLAALAAPSPARGQSAPPPTERHDVTEVFYGQSVTDPYRWLEDWHEGKAADWLKAQDTYTRSALST